MTRNIHHVAENPVRSHSGMKLSARSLFLATAITTGIAYLLCILFVILAPQPTMAFFSAILHANLTGIKPSLERKGSRGSNVNGSKSDHNAAL